VGVARELGQLLTTHLPRSTDCRRDRQRRCTRDQLNQPTLGAHATRRLQQQCLTVPFPTENAPRTASLLRPARKHEPAVRDGNIYFVTAERVSLTVSGGAKPLRVLAKQNCDLLVRSCYRSERREAFHHT
jgi:hypothetical protein